MLEFAARLSPVEGEADAKAGDTEPGTPLREDRVERWLLPGEATGPAPESTEDLFRVPPVLGG